MRARNGKEDCLGVMRVLESYINGIKIQKKIEGD